MTHMTGKKAIKLQTTMESDLQTLISLCRWNVECAQSIAAELEGIQDLAEEVLRKVTR